MKRIIMLTAALLLTLTDLLAVPAWRGAMKHRQPDGTIVTYYMRGDEFHHQLLAPDGTCLALDSTGYMRPATASELNVLRVDRMADAPRHLRMKTPKASRFQIAGFPTKGEIRCLVILAEFNDLQFTFGHDYHHRMLNEQGFSDDGATGCAAEYFTDQSMQTFFPKFDVVGPVKLPKNYAYYGQNSMMGGNDEGTGQMIIDACKLAQAEGINFADYDNNDDGEVDMVYVIYAGYGEASGAGSDYVWPKKWQLAAEYLSLNLDGKKIDVYACSAELFGNPQWEAENGGHHSAGIGTVCHEFGHVLGFADHYSTAAESVTPYLLGSYDIMDYGPYNNQSRTPPSYNAFERLTLGWLTPDTLVNDAQTGIVLDPIATSNHAYVLTTSNKNEFYLLENRQQEGWDSYLPGSGMMITHVDFDELMWYMNMANNDPSHRRFYMECADNDYAYDFVTGRQTEWADLFPCAANGNNRFTDVSRPAAQPFTGETLDKWVTNIQNSDGRVTFDYQNNHLETPKGFAVSTINDHGFTAQWQAVDRADRYELQLFRLEHESERPVALAEGFWRMQAGTVASPDGSNIAGQLNDYTTMPGWTGEQVYQAGGTCKIGSAGASGRLTLPTLNLATGNGVFTVVARVQSAQTKTPVFSITANGQTARTRLTSAARDYYATFQGGLTATTIELGSVNERAFIDTVVVVRSGDVSALFPGARQVSVTGEVATTASPEVDDPLVPRDTTVVTATGTAYTFDTLEPDTHYALQVRAMNNDMGSAYTAIIYVFTNESMGITETMHYALRTMNSYDLQGRRYATDAPLPTGRLLIQNCGGRWTKVIH